MRRIILFFLLLCSISVVAQIKPPYKIVYGGGGGLIQSVKINFDDTNRSVSGYNTIYGSASNTLNLLNTSSSPTGFNLLFVSGVYGSEDEGVQTDPFGRFSSDALKYMINRGGSDIVWQFTGLDPTKNYRLKFAAVQSYNDANDATTVVLNGVSYPLGGPNLANTVYPTTDIYYSVNLPSSGIINMTFSPTLGAGGYACMNAMILEEYNP